MAGFQVPISPDDINRLAESIESVQITWLTGISAGAVFVLGLVAASLARRYIRLLGQRTELASPETFRLVGRIAWIAIMFYATSAALGVLGFDVLPLLSVLGIVTIVVAIGLRPLFENIAAGLTLQTRRPIHVGDQVNLFDFEGTVLDMNARTVDIETVAGESVRIPNRNVLDSPIVIYTHKPVRRSTLDVGLDYASDLTNAAEVIRDVVGQTHGVVADPPVHVFLYEFGDSTINASVWFWHKSDFQSAWQVRHEVVINVKRALDEAGITIAFPQRVLWQGDGPAKTVL